LHIWHIADVCKLGAGTHIRTTQRAMEESGLESGDCRDEPGSRVLRKGTAARRDSFSESALMKKLREELRIFAAALAELCLPGMGVTPILPRTLDSTVSGQWCPGRWCRRW
jgi:hypothetical protein